jgi:ATP-dependent protease ClpP protease subunit
MTSIKDVLELYNGLRKVEIRGGHDWYSVKAHDDGEEATVSIYDEIGMWGVTAQDFVNALDALPTTTKTINLRLNSPGGGVFEGLTIANRLREHPANVAVTVDGIAASIASVIAMSGDTVIMGRGSQMMIHNPSGLVLGDSAEMRQMADLLDKLARDSIASAYQAKAGGTAQDWLDRMSGESWYSADEAVAVGLADTTTDAAEKDAPTDVARVHSLTAHGWRHAGREYAPDPAAADRSNRSRAAVARVRGLREGRK